MIHVKYIPCLFEDEKIEFDTHNLTIVNILFSLMKKYPEVKWHDASGMVVRVNGKAVSPFQWVKFPLKDGDNVTILMDYGYDVILWIGAAATWLVSSSFLGAEIFAGFYVWSAVLLAISIASTVYSLVSSPDTPRTGRGLNNSPTYGWDSIQMQIKAGVPVPVVYGEHIVPGNLIACFVRTDGDKNYLKMLIAIGEGEIEGIMKADGSGVCTSNSQTPLVYINDNLFSNFSGVTWDYRLGTDNQTVINGFDNIEHVHTDGSFQLDYGTPYTYQTDEEVEAFEVRIRCPGFNFRQGGNFLPRYAKMGIFYKKHTDGNYTLHGYLEIWASTSNQVRRYYRVDGLTKDIYDIKVTRETSLYFDPNENFGPRVIIIDSVTKITYDALIYPHTALLALEILATEQLNGQVPNVLPVTRGRKVLNLDTSVTEWTRNPVYNTNDVLVTARFGLGQYISQANINNDQLIEMADHCYEQVGDGTKRLGNSATSTSFTDSDFDFTGSVGKTICCKCPTDTTQYTTLLITSITGTHQANGAAWKYSDGTTGSGTPTDFNWEWGENRLELDMVLDVQDNAITLIQRMCAAYRASPLWARDAIQIGIDKKETPSYIFSMGNILEKSFKYTFDSEKNKFNVASIEFLDRENRFDKATVDVEDNPVLATGVSRRTKSLPLYGITRHSQVYRDGRFHIYAGKYQDEQVQFGGGIDSIHSWPMDVIKLSHDVPQWGYSGRIIAATTTTITFDREVEVPVAGFTYVVTVRKPDTGGTETLETRIISPNPLPIGFYTTVTVAAFSFTPEVNGIYAFGKQGIEAKPFRIMGIKRDPNNNLQVVASEYSYAVYVDTDIILPEVQYSDLPNPMTACPQVEALSIAESGMILSDGTWAGYLEVGFRIPEASSFVGWDHAEVWVGIRYESGLPGDQGVAYQHYGDTVKEVGYTIEGHNYLMMGNIVFVKVVSVSKSGLRADFNQAPYSDILIMGKTIKPSDITNFTAIQQGNRVVLNWTPVTDRDIGSYEIREGASWGTGLLIARGVTDIPWLWMLFGVGTYNLMIKAVDRTGNYSETEASDSIVITSAPAGNILATLEGVLNPSAYSGTIQQFDCKGIYGASPVVGLIPAQGWDDGYTWDSAVGGQTNWDYPVTATSGYFETAIIDFGLETKVNILVNDEYTSEGGSPTLLYEIKTADGVGSWGSYATFVSGEYFCRYAKFKITLTTSSTTYNLFMRHFVITGCQSGIVGINFSNKTIAASGGTAITYGMTFASVPSVIVTPIGSTLLIPKVTSRTTTGCTVQLYNTSSSDVGGVADIIIQGQ